jgi:threonine dehydrogenase-like Zn-dependent dehydrogenase
LPGGLAEYIAVPAVNTVKVNSTLAFAQAALVEPLGCIIHSSNTAARARARYVLNADAPDSRVRCVLICGAGPAGLLFTQYLRSVIGYTGSLIVSDPNEIKRRLAKTLGADETIDPVDSDIVELVRDYTGGKGVQYLIEASGSGKIFGLMPGLVCKQATVLLYGHGHVGNDLSLLNNVLFKEPTLVASVGASGGFEHDGRPSVYTNALNLIEQGKIRVEPLITNQYGSFDDIERALTTDMNSSDYIKGVVALRD